MFLLLTKPTALKLKAFISIFLGSSQRIAQKIKIYILPFEIPVLDMVIFKAKKFVKYVN